jgi:SAM-dependent methyltransferase
VTVGERFKFHGRATRHKLARLLDRLLERRYRIETSTEVGIEELGSTHPKRMPYVPINWLTMRRILARLEVSTEDVFVDFGSGKGRPVFLAARYPFKRVIGVEISPELHRIAQANIRRNRHRLKCRDVQLVNCDVVDYQIPDDVTVAFLFNPFRGDIFNSLIDNILRSIDECPRTVRLVYVNPFEEESLLATERARPISEEGWRFFGPMARVYQFSWNSNGNEPQSIPKQRMPVARWWRRERATPKGRFAGSVRASEDAGSILPTDELVPDGNRSGGTASIDRP